MRNLRPLAPLALLALAAAGHAAGPFGSPSGAYAGVRTYGSLHNLNPTGTDVQNAGGDGISEATTQMDMASYGDLPEFSGSGKAYASEITGRIGAQTSLDKLDQGGGAYAQSLAVARIWDTITFDTPKLTQAVPVRLALDGMSHGGGPAEDTESWAQIHLWVYDLDNSRYVSNYTSDSLYSDSTYDAFIPTDTSSAYGGKRHFTIGYEIQSNSAIFRDAIGVRGTSADYFHTLKFGWDLPSGLTYTSNSGLFNPGATQAVPEPAPLLALAVGALGLARRRR